MRLWRNKDGAIITDEQLVGYIAHFGSLSAAAKGGDVVLLEGKEGQSSKADASRVGRGKSFTLKDYLAH